MARLTKKQARVWADLLREGGDEATAKSILETRIDVAADWDASAKQKREAEKLKRLKKRLGFGGLQGSAVESIALAERAFQGGKCLVAGQAIDRAYVALGKRMDRRAWRRLKKVDEKFERACVRKRPA